MDWENQFHIWGPAHILNQFLSYGLGMLDRVPVDFRVHVDHIIFSVLIWHVGLHGVWITVILNWFQVSTDESDTLRSLLTKKEADMKEMEDKYRKYLEKAKTVSKH